MEAINTAKLTYTAPSAETTRSARRKVNGEATAAMLIQMASEILTASPTLRKRSNITLMDLAAADKVRKELTRRSAKGC